MIDLEKEKPIYHRVYVSIATKKVEKELNTTLELPKQFREEFEQELDFKASIGTIVSMGPTAFEGYPESQKPKVGQKVRIDRYAGKLINLPVNEEDEERHIVRIMSDKDILGVVYE